VWHLFVRQPISVVLRRRTISAARKRGSQLPWDAVLEVVIVSYRCGQLLRRCLQSLREHPSADGRVTVVDNVNRDTVVCDGTLDRLLGVMAGDARAT
jgi:hypothetical protein